MSPRRNRSRQINPDAPTQRTALRTGGMALAGVGSIFVAVGLIDFFSSFGSFGNPPTKFWCIFVGMPMVGIGASMLKFGYMGAVARYVAGEAAPVATDTLNYAVGETEHSIRKVGRALRGDDALSDGEEQKTVRERLEKLEGLRRDGLIDDADFEEQKDRILSDL